MTKTKLKAFTLIELLIVIVIIGILAVALIPRLTGAQATARDTSRKAAVQQYVTALEMYKAENNSALPANLAALAPTYLSTLPTDPQSQTFEYFTGGSSTSPNYYVGIRLERTTQGNYWSTGAAALGATTGGTLLTNSGQFFLMGR